MADPPALAIRGRTEGALAPGRFPRAPHGWQRRVAWRSQGFLALSLDVGEIRGGRELAFGLVPIQAGRVVLRGARFRRIPLDGAARGRVDGLPAGSETLDAARSDVALDALRTALDQRFLVAWSAPEVAALLERSLGGRQRLWLHRSVDVRRLVAALEPPAGRSDGSEAFGLGAAAEAFGVPCARPCDALDTAVTIGTLFLVAATKLATHGHGDVRSLLWRREASLVHR